MFVLSTRYKLLLSNTTPAVRVKHLGLSSVLMDTVVHGTFATRLYIDQYLYYLVGYLPYMSSEQLQTVFIKRVPLTKQV